MPSNNNRKTTKRRRRRRKRRAESRPHDGPIGHVPKSAKSPGIGASIGASLGNLAEGAIKSLFGSGDYEQEFQHAGGFDVEENSFVKPITAEQVPEVEGSESADRLREHGAMRIKHREYLRDFSASTLPVYAEYEICPTDPTTFPWLSGIAEQFEQWIPCGVVFEFVSTCGNAVSSTNAALGSVSMATQYNALEGPFNTKKEVLNHFFATSGRTSENQMHAIECDIHDRPTSVLYTRNNHPVVVAAGEAEDPRLRSLGWTTVWREGSQATYVAGELWITYDIILLKPRLPAPAVPSYSVAEVYQLMREASGGEDADYFPADIPKPALLSAEEENKDDYVHLPDLLKARGASPQAAAAMHQYVLKHSGGTAAPAPRPAGLPSPSGLTR